MRHQNPLLMAYLEAFGDTWDAAAKELKTCRNGLKPVQKDMLDILKKKTNAVDTQYPFAVPLRMYMGSCAQQIS